MAPPRSRRPAALSRAGLTLLLCASPRIAAFRPVAGRGRPGGSRPDAASAAAIGPEVSTAFVGHSSRPHGDKYNSSSRRCMLPMSRRTPLAICRKEETERNWARNAAVSDDDDGGDDDGIRARVRQRVTKASKRVQQIVSAPGTAALYLYALGRSESKASSSSSSKHGSRLEARARREADARSATDAVSLAKTSASDAFRAADLALAAAEAEIARARRELEKAKEDAALGLAAAEEAAKATEGKVASLEASEAGVADDGLPFFADSAVEFKISNDDKRLEKVNGDIDVGEGGTVGSKQQSTREVNVEAKVDEDYDDDEEEEPVIAVEMSGTLVERIGDDYDSFDVSDLSYDDVDYTLTDMAPPFIGENECLVPGEPVVRVEKAPQNSRRIFAGVDIPVSVDDVWSLLTDYPNLQKAVPNLVVNEVLELYPGGDGPVVSDDDVDPALSPAQQCRALSRKMRGAVLRQVGSAKVVGVNFSARTKLEVREWPQGMPDFAHFEDEIFEGKSRADRAREGRARPLARHVFPRPFALSSLPHKDISMQSVRNDDGEFRMYQGVWRMQPLPGCSPPGGSAMRLTYAVEVSPRPYLPVALVEGRIARDLCTNLEAIRDIFEERDAGVGKS